MKMKEEEEEEVEEEEEEKEGGGGGGREEEYKEEEEEDEEKRKRTEEREEYSTLPLFSFLLIPLSSSLLASRQVAWAPRFACRSWRFIKMKCTTC